MIIFVKTFSVNKIKIIIPFYNPGEFLELCVSSILSQNYDNYEVLFINDCSTDGSPQKYIPLKENESPILNKTKCKNVIYWDSTERKTALLNIHDGIIKFATCPDDIVVLLDGDDWLLNKNVLSYINDFYEKNTDCWMMYGSSQWTDGRQCCSRPYSEDEFKSGIRKTPFKVSHIRTFRAGLYHSIEKQDPDFNCMKNKEKEWYKMTYDVAMFIPMLEMAGLEHICYNNKKLYVYNRDNPISDDKVNQNLQWEIHSEICGKKPFNKIQNYK